MIVTSTRDQRQLAHEREETDKVHRNITEQYLDITLEENENQSSFVEWQKKQNRRYFHLNLCKPFWNEESFL